MKGLLVVQLREVGLASGSVNRISYFEWKHAEAFIYKITPTLLGLTCIPLDTLHATSVALYGKTKRGGGRRGSLELISFTLYSSLEPADANCNTMRFSFLQDSAVGGNIFPEARQGTRQLIWQRG